LAIEWEMGLLIGFGLDVIHFFLFFFVVELERNV